VPATEVEMGSLRLINPVVVDSSRKLQINCVISFCFCLNLILHVCVARFDVMKNLKIFWKLNKT